MVLIQPPCIKSQMAKILAAKYTIRLVNRYDSQITEKKCCENELRIQFLLFAIVILICYYGIFIPQNHIDDCNMIKRPQQTTQQFRSDLTIEEIKSRSRSRIFQIEPINYEKSNLFFIKSKHAFRDYKNHEYFESQRCDEKIQSHDRSSQFVEIPPPFGINNAYCFVRDEVSKNLLRKNNQHHFKTINGNTRYDGKEKSRRQQMTRKERRSINLTLPNLNELPTQSVIFKPLKADRRKSSHQIELKQVSNHFHTTKEGRFSDPSKLQPKFNTKQYFITVIYANKFQSLSQFGSIQIKVNIFDYIIKTFHKTKINYLEISNDQLHFIAQKLTNIYETQKENFSYKDIINCKTIHEVFQILLQSNESSMDFRQIIRYFFVANEEVYTYQLDCIKDEIRFLINQETNSINHNEKIYIFDIKSGRNIGHLQELIKYSPQKFVVGISADTFELYQAYNKQKNSKIQAEQRVRKWKSIIPTETLREFESHHISSEKYQTLFSNAQKKRGYFNQNKKKPTFSVKPRSFIDRDKLIKFENIFQ